MTDYTAFQKVNLILFNNSMKNLPTEFFVLKILKKFFITTLIPFRTPEKCLVKSTAEIVKIVRFCGGMF